MTPDVIEETYTSPNLRKYQSGSRIYDWHVRCVTDKLLELVGGTEPQSLLDAGCGEGFTVARISRRFPDVKLSGVDVSEEAIAYAQRHVGEQVRFRTGSIFKLPFSDKAFDTVLCSEVLEHVGDPSAAISELKRVARNYVIITVPLEPYFQWLNVLGQKLGLSINPGHVNFWSKKAFMRFMRYHFEEPEFAWKHIYQFMVART